MTFLGESNENFLLNSLYKFRIKLCETLDSCLNKDASSLIKNILFGEDSLDDKILESYRATGIAHILAVSGLHVGIVYNLILWVVRPFKLNDRFKFIMTGAFLMTYAAITAFEVSVLRACIMHICSSGAVLLNRKNDIFNSLCLSAIIILLINPLDLFSVAFQMSFLCVLAIAFFLPFINKKFSKKKESKLYSYIKTSLCMFLSVNIVLAPVSVYYFNSLSLVSPIANFIIVPLSGVVISLCIFALLLRPIFLPFSAFMFKALNIILDFMIKIPEGLSKLSFANVFVPSPRLYLLLFYYLVVLLVFGYINLKTKKGLLLFSALSLSVSLLLFFNVYTYYNDAIYFLDVGQGDCIVIKNEGEVIMVDTGKENALTSAVLPFLYESGINRIEKLILTHTDFDHAGGAYELLGRIKIEEIILNNDGSETYEKIKTKANELRIKLSGAKAGDELCNGVYVLSPSKDYDNTNDSSIVLNVNMKGKEILLLGDAAEKALRDVFEGYEIKADVIKCSHHGSYTKAAEELYKEVEAEYAVISVGENNSYGLPDYTVMRALKEAGSRIYRTDQNGCVRLRVDERGEIVLKTFNALND